MTKTLKCDKPVDLDEARKAKGLPRRKRDDPKATAYELGNVQSLAHFHSSIA